MKKIPQRTCIGCLTRQPKAKLIRLVVKNSQVVIDASGKSHGRGAYLCLAGKGIKGACLKKAVEREAFKRAFGKTVDVKKLLTKHGPKKEKRNSQKKASNSTAGGGDLGPC